MAVRRLAETQPERFAFSADNLGWAERTIKRFPEGRQASAIIPLLWRAQEQEGWLTKPAMEGVGCMLGMPLIRVLEVATFYTMFHLEPVGTKAHVQVCGTTPCMLRGSGEIIDACRRRIHEHPHHLSADGAFSWEEVECLGACVNAPMVQIHKDTYEDLTPESFEAVLDAFARGESPKAGPQNGRQASTPITGLTSLTGVDGDKGEQVPEPDNSDLAPSGAAEQARPDHGSANIAPGEPRPSETGASGGEQSEDEQARRRGRARRKTDGADPAGAETANQNIGRVDADGRSDEAASRAVPDRNGGGKERLPEDSSAESEEHVPGGHEHDRPGPRSDRDSAKGDKEG